MGFIDKLKDVATGKSAVERAEEAKVNAEIRKEMLAAQLKERKVQAIKLAQEKEKVFYEKKIKALRQPKVGFFGSASSEYKTYGSPFGQPRFARERVITRRGKKGKMKRVTIKTTPRYNIRNQINKQGGFNPVTGQGRGYNPLGF